MSRALRFPLVLALIALLLARGWVGDAMAMSRIQHSPPVMAAAVVADESAGPMQHDECHEALPAAGEPETPQAGDDCGTCTACQVCHSVALAALPSVNTPAFSVPANPPRHAVVAFASAEPQRGFKPPIA